MKDKEESPLNKLVIKSSKKVEEIMYSTLKDYIGLDKDTHEVIFLDTAKDLTIEKRVLLLLLGYTAMKILGWIDNDALKPKEVAMKIGANHNTVRYILSGLHKKGIVDRSRGLYRIKLSRILEIANMFKKEG